MATKVIALKVSAFCFPLLLAYQMFFSGLCLFRALIKKICTKLPNESQNLDIRTYCVSLATLGIMQFYRQYTLCTNKNLYTNLHQVFHNYLVECTVGSYVKAQFSISALKE